MKIFLYILCLCLSLGVSNVRADGSQVIFSLPNVSLPTNSSVIYTIVNLPQLGRISLNGSVIQSFGGFIANLSLLTYQPLDIYDFSYVNGGGPCNASFFYDSFLVNATVFTNGTVSQSANSVGICLMDVEDYPATIDQHIPVTNFTVKFTVPVTDLDDRIGTKDGKRSTYSFHSSSGAVSSGAGIVFNRTSTAIGILSDCSGTSLIAGVLYPNETFCFLPNSQDGQDSIQFYANDKANGTARMNTLTFSTRELLVCDGLEAIFPCTVYTEENSTVSFPLPSQEGSLVPFVYVLQITSLPSKGRLKYANGSFVSVGDILPPDLTLNYSSAFGYYNQFYFPDFDGGYATFLHASGVPIGLCANAQNGCPDFFTYIALQQSNLTFSSQVGTLSFIVRREIVESMGICPSYASSLWYPEACTSYGKSNSIIPIYLAATDGRVDTPEYVLRIRSLPPQGTLYYNAQPSSSQYLRGAKVLIGDLIPALVGFYPNLLYVGNANYSNSLVYDVLPASIVSLVDQYGMSVGNGTDSFTYDAFSGLNYSFAAPIGTYNIYVERNASDQLTVCSSTGYSIYGTSCASFGFESNDLYGQYAIPIYLNVNNTYGEVVEFTVLSLPSNGTLYFNTGNDTQLELGGAVSINSFFISPSNGTNIPDLIYVGSKNYYSDVVYGSNSTLRLFTDQNNVPIGDCLNAEKFGCPDSFQFQANTSSGRESNVGTYQIFVDSLMSDITLAGPSFIQFIPGLKYLLVGPYAITYSDPDGDLYNVDVQITVYEGYVGFSGPLDKFVFSAANTCFNTTGCNDYIEFYGLPSDVRYMFQNMFYVQSGNSSGVIYISLIKKVPDGVNTQNKFLSDATDLVFALDIPYGLFPTEYEYETITTTSPTPPIDFCVTDGANAVMTDLVVILISVFGSLLLILGLVILFLLVCCICNDKNKQTKPSFQANAVLGEQRLSGPTPSEGNSNRNYSLGIRRRRHTAAMSTLDEERQPLV